MRTMFPGAPEAWMFGYFDWSVESVPGPKLFDRPDMPSSYWRARVRAYMTVQLVWPFSSSFDMPSLAPLS